MTPTGIYSDGIRSRVQLAKSTKLSRPSVTELTQELLGEGLIEEVGSERIPGKVGKHPTLLAFNPNAYHLVAVDIGGTSISCVLADLHGKILYQQQARFNHPSVPQAIEQLLRLIGAVVEQATRPLLGIAIGVPGRVDSDTGIVQDATNLGWRNVPLRKSVSERFQLPTYIGNDTNVAALGEYRFGQGRATENLVVIMLGTGIGAGIVLRGKVIEGESLAAGEIGHFPFREIDELCTCGRRGCLETVSSGWGLARRAQHIAQAHPESLLNQFAADSQIDALTVQHAAEKGDPHAITLIETAGIYLGLAMTHIIQLLNPGHILLAGNLVRFGDFLFDPLLRTIREHTVPEVFSRTEIAVSQLGDRIVLLGATALLLEQELNLWRV